LAVDQLYIVDAFGLLSMTSYLSQVSVESYTVEKPQVKAGMRNKQAFLKFSLQAKLSPHGIEPWWSDAGTPDSGQRVPEICGW
jgi:hypothetical protein